MFTDSPSHIFWESLGLFIHVCCSLVYPCLLLSAMEVGAISWEWLLLLSLSLVLMLVHFNPPPGHTLLREFVTVISILMMLWRNDPPFPNEKNKTSSLFLFLHKMCLFVKLPNCPVFSSVLLLSHVQPFGTPWTEECQAPCPSPTPGVYSNSCPLSQWCHPTISISVVPFSSHFQSFPASGSLQMSQFLASGGQNIGVSASTSVFPMNIQDWSPLGWTGWISLQSKGLSRVFSNTTVQKYQLFGTQVSL